MTIEYRQITIAERRRFSSAVEQGFGKHYTPTHDAFCLDKKLLSPDMTMCAFDDGEIVGTTGAYQFESAVPGGAIIKNAGITAVTVSATHRRRNILTNMMQRLLKQERDKGQVIASLWASESIIYGRFGYGVAIQHEAIKVDTTRAELKHMPAIPGRVRYVDIHEARQIFPAAWDAAVSYHVGIPKRSDDQWDRSMIESSSQSDWGQPWFVVYEEYGEPLGYAIYYLKELGIFAGQSSGLINADMVIYSNPASHAALWNHLLNIDLYDQLTAWRQPVDDSLPWMLADQRQLERKPYDGIWYRIMDVEEALNARTYMTEGNLVIQIEDAFIPEWGGRFELDGGPDGVICGPTTKTPSITLTTESLAAIYLGGANTYTMQKAGRAEEHTSGSIALFDRMLTTPKTPWCPLMF